jgi:hypothetical protein
MTSPNDNPGRYGCLLLTMVLLFVLLVALALAWRSGWWRESGARLPRGTRNGPTVLPEDGRLLHKERSAPGLSAAGTVLALDAAMCDVRRDLDPSAAIDAS